VDTLADALCASRLASGDYRYTTARSSMESDVVGRLVQIAVVEELDLAPPTESDVDLEQIPGWDEMTGTEQDALADFVDGDARLAAALQDLGGDLSADPDRAMAAGLEEFIAVVRERDVSIAVNPRYGLDIVEGELVPSTDLSVAVSEFATAADAEQPSLDYLDSLPDAQLCGERPPADQAAQAG
jgi:hypothetical protein